MTANPALEQIGTSTKKLKLCAANHYPDLKSKRYCPVLDMIATPSCPFSPKIRLLTDKFPPVSSADDRHRIPNPVGNRCSRPPLKGFPQFCNTRPCTSNMALIERVRPRCRKLVVVLYSERPLIIVDILPMVQRN